MASGLRALPVGWQRRKLTATGEAVEPRSVCLRRGWDALTVHYSFILPPSIYWEPAWCGDSRVPAELTLQCRMTRKMKELQHMLWRNIKQARRQITRQDSFSGRQRRILLWCLSRDLQPGCGPCSRPGKSLPGKHSRKGEGPDRGTGRGREGRGGGQSGKTVTGERSESRWGEGSHTGPPRPGPLLCSRAVLRKWNGEKK